MNLKLRIATYNVESLDEGPDVFPPLSERIAALRPYLEDLRADVLCLQEVNAQKPDKHGHQILAALDKLLAGTRYAEFHRATTVSQDGEVLDIHNLVILSRFPILEQQQFQNDLMPAPNYEPVTAQPRAPGAHPVRWDRPVLAVTLDADGHRLHVLNLHLRAPRAAPVPGQKTTASQWRSIGAWAEGYFLASIKRIGQAVETRLAIEQLFDADARALILVAGDLNAGIREMPLRILVGDLEDIGNPALAARQLIPLEGAVAAEQRFSVRHKGEKLMLDHLLASQELHRRVEGVEIYNRGLPDEADEGAGHARPAASFHAPVVAEFTLKPSTGNPAR